MRLFACFSSFFSERVTMHGQFFWLDVATSDVVASRVVNL